MELETRIEELLEKHDIEDSNLIIVEDKEDTKKATVEELKKSLSGDNKSPNTLRFYSSQFMKNIIDTINSSLNGKASAIELDRLSNRVSQIVASAGSGKDTEIIDARDGEVSVHERILRDFNLLSDTKMSVLSKRHTVSGNPITIKNPSRIPVGLCTINIIYPIITDIGRLNINNGGSVTTKNITSSDAPFEYNFTQDNCELSCNIPNAVIYVTYEAYVIDSEYLYNEINNLRDTLYNNMDKCNLITDYGTYVYPDELYNTNDDAATYTNDGKITRDNKNTLRVHTRLEASSNPKFTIKCNPVKFELCSVIFYMTKEIIKTFDSTDAIIVKVSSDSPVVMPSNYYQYSINSGELIPGWNCLKKPLKDFIKVGNPDREQIQSIRIEINRNNQMNNSDIYFSSIVFNQRMKPTVLLNFNGVYKEGFEYTYPYLLARKVPCTIFTNTGTTLTKDEKSKLCKWYYNNKWDIAPYGCHPNKEILLETDNQFDQYQKLLETRSYIESNFRNNPISYSAPYGNIQDTTIDILKNIGYKIARIETTKNTYCSFFGRNDFCIPVVKVGNKNDSEDIIALIEYIIETGQTLALFTNTVTEYGTEVSLKQITFEFVLDYILDKVDKGELQVLSFEEFYKSCI